MKRAAIWVLISLCFLLIGCQSLEQKQMLMSFGKEGAPSARYPELFIPGLGFKGNFWTKSKMFKFFEQCGWVYGGDIRIKNVNGSISIANADQIIPGTLYTISFSSTQLGIIQQGRELVVAINLIKKITHKDRLILIGHSMGGLAAREYLQSSYFQHDVAAYISIGTPHKGSDFDLERPLLRLVPQFLRNQFWHVDESGDAVRDLRSNSIYLNGGNESKSPDRFRSKDINGNGRTNDDVIGLNEISKHPLPEDLLYFSVIGGGDALISTTGQSKASDGIVDIESQDLNNVPGINVPSFVIASSHDHFGEADDVWIIIQAIRTRQYLERFSKFNILEYKSGKPVFQPLNLTAQN